MAGNTSQGVSHRMAEVGRDIWKPVWSNLPTQVGPPSAGCPGQLFNTYSFEDGGDTTSLGNELQCLVLDNIISRCISIGRFDAFHCG